MNDDDPIREKPGNPIALAAESYSLTARLVRAAMQATDPQVSLFALTRSLCVFMVRESRSRGGVTPTPAALRAGLVQLVGDVFDQVLKELGP